MAIGGNTVRVRLSNAFGVESVEIGAAHLAIRASGSDAAKMEDCRCGIVRHSTLWVGPVLVSEVEFVEWTPEGHLRHARFVRILGEVR
jgi:ATP-dependent DNA ligase